jgi:anthraniloyl-CoA monooxygenase
MASRGHRWDDIEIHYRGQVLTSTGHGFSGLSRRTLLDMLARRCCAAGVQVRPETDIPDPASLTGADLVVGADGANSTVRQRWHAEFRPALDPRPNRYVWLGTTRPFPAFTFYFKEDTHGLWRVHAYQYEPGLSTFIVEATPRTWRKAGLDHATEADTLAFCEALFADELQGHRLVANKSVWRSFVTIRTECWWRENVVLIGDAAHTAHFSVGSGTKLAMEDAVALADALGRHADVRAALAAFEAARRPPVESLQRAAQVSYMEMDPLQFGFNLLTRSLRVTHENLRVRDPAFVRRVDTWFAEEAVGRSGVPVSTDPAPPPMFTPFRLRDLLLENRIAVSPMCQYSAVDGTPNDWHLVHLGTRAMGGAGLVFTEMTDVSDEGRISPGCTGLYRPEHVGAWKRIVDFVHANSGAKIAVQLGHAGRKGSTRRQWEGDVEPLPQGNWPTLAASPIPYFPHSQVPRTMTRPDMETVTAEFVRAAELAVEAGFDMLEIHCAHGYLLAGFISPLTNERDDEYGGTLENRMRFPLEVFDAVRAVWPAERPMSVRVSATDWYPEGIEPADTVEVARLFQAHGCDVIDVSAGQTVPDQRPVYGRLFQAPFADRVRHEAGIATMAVGNISSWADVNTILAAGRADLCLLARAHLWDPYWTRHAAYALGYPLPWPDPYATLNGYTPRFE